VFENRVDEWPYACTDSTVYPRITRLRIQPMASGGSPVFTGSGDAVSAYFAPPTPATWKVAHDGQTGFFVYAHCLGGSIVVEDKSGAFQDAPQVEFPRGPCFWEVRADGTWSLTPQ
jgi:hypothetical protein